MPSPDGPDSSRARVVRLLLDRAYIRREEPFQLASGGWSRDYVDARLAISRGADLRLVAGAIVDLAAAEGVDFDAVGGLTMGADPLAHAIALLGDRAWFAVRKAAKSHGKQRLVEGAPLDASTRVLLVDDIVTTGGSIVQALEAVETTGAQVVLAVTLCDRGETAGRVLAARGIRYRPLTTYADLGIEPVSGPSEEVPGVPPVR
jgi:orotate phosphoribosyltransferase